MLLCVFLYTSPTWDLCLSKDERWSTQSSTVPVSQARNGQICQWAVEQSFWLFPASLWGSSLSSEVLEEQWGTKGTLQTHGSAALLWESSGFHPNIPDIWHAHWLSPPGALTDAGSTKAGIAGDPGAISSEVLLLRRRHVPARDGRYCDEKLSLCSHSGRLSPPSTFAQQQPQFQAGKNL